MRSTALKAAPAYFRTVAKLLGEIDPAKVLTLIEMVEAAIRNDKKVMLMGNGGSGANAAHAVADWQKGTQVATGRPVRTMCFNDNTPLVSAWANDTGYDNIFTPQVQCWAEPGDTVIGISGSGNSPNVLNAIRSAKGLGIATFGLTGFKGGELAPITDECIIVASNNMQAIEDVHMSILHACFLELVARCKK